MFRKLLEKAKYQHGFTLLELLIVIVMIGILSLIVVPGLVSGRERARIARGKAFEKQLYRTYVANSTFLYEFENASNHGQDSAAQPQQISFIEGAGATMVTDTPTNSAGAMNFTGALDSYIRLNVSSGTAIAAATDPGNVFGFAAWFKATSLPDTGGGYIVYRRGQHTGLFMDTAGLYRGIVWFDDATTLPGLTTGRNLNDGKWHHLAMIVDDLNKKVTMYFDGADILQVTYTKNLKVFGSVPYAVGGDYANSIYSARGIIDNAMFFTQ